MELSDLPVIGQFISLIDLLTPSNTILVLIFDIIVVYLMYLLLKSLYNCFLRPSKNLIERYGQNSYVIITGATFGIGREYANSFARRGFNLILVSRTLSKLEKVKKEISAEFPQVKVVVIQFDFSKQTELKDYTSTFEGLIKTYDISVLVNNVGVSHEDYMKCLDINAKECSIHDYINVNILSQTILCKIFMDFLSKRAKKSAIITMSSLAGDFPYPGNAIYSATKAYNDFLSRALFGEYGFESGNIDFLSVKPSYVESAMSQMKPDGFDCITAKQLCESALSELGYTDQTTGYFTHKIQRFALGLLPKFAKRIAFRLSKETEEKLQARHQKKN